MVVEVNARLENLSTSVFQQFLWYPSVCDWVLTQRDGGQIANFTF